MIRLKVHWLALLLLGLQVQTFAAQIDHLHFIIPGGAGGGWDSTARSIGRVIQQGGIAGETSFENIAGAGGGVAIGRLIETAKHQKQTLMVNSTPIIVRSLTRQFPYSWHDLTPVARLIGDYQVLAVRPDSPVHSFADIIERFRNDPRLVKVAGGSVRGDLDHLVPATALRTAGLDARKLIYVPYSAGGRALSGFLSGEADLLSTGLGEVINYHRASTLRIVAVSAPERLAGLGDIPTFAESGFDFEFVNWRGVFAAPGLSSDEAARLAAAMRELKETDAWQQVLDNYGWQPMYLDAQAFAAFLKRQEREIGSQLRSLGYL